MHVCILQLVLCICILCIEYSSRHTTVVVGILARVGISLPAGTLPQNTYYPTSIMHTVLTSRRKKQTAGTPFPARPPLAVDGGRNSSVASAYPAAPVLLLTHSSYSHMHTVWVVCKKKCLRHRTTRMSLILLSTSQYYLGVLSILLFESFTAAWVRILTCCFLHILYSTCQLVLCIVLSTYV